MNISHSAEDLTMRFESCRTIAYQDVKGVWTIGYGRTKDVHEGNTCTQEQATAWLMDDMRWAEFVVNKLVTVPLMQGQFDALVDFVFNVGSENFEHSTLHALLNAGKYDEAADEFDKWDHAGGKVVAGLLRRRDAERAEFQEGSHGG